MKLIKQSDSKEKYYSRERYFDELEKKQQRQEKKFKLFLYVTIILFAIAGILAITEFAIILGVFGTIVASFCIVGWWSAYTIIIIQETSKKYKHPVEFSNKKVTQIKFK